ncbi:inorganic phosphate transporter family protein [bacterium]|nr:inorganic phosphate transporter [Candidatus Omnitrophota bacterium]MBU2529322.1 inorganic phosphate transporter family protein [bacterium]MBU3930280.1 inorganic phosphate transporter family protein [bacterium]MBU4122788.1 inorganic phosphate transporter family protein [bacterium]
MFNLLPGIYLGWGLGANDAANVFGPQAHSGIISYRGAILFTSIFIMLGAMIGGARGFEHIGAMVQGLTPAEIFIVTLSAGIMMNLMSFAKIPASTSHSIVGSMIGAGLAAGSAVDYSKVMKSVYCWIVTPIGAAIFTVIFYHLLSFIWAKRIKNIMMLNWTIRIASIVIGCYGAYSLGANNLANVVGIYVESGMISSFNAQILGGLAIVFGVVTYSKNVMSTVGSGITVLDPFSALVTILSGSLILHIFAQMGVPVSSSQAVVGAVLGVGLVKGAKTVSYGKIALIFAGWVVTLAGTVLFSFLLCKAYTRFFI